MQLPTLLSVLFVWPNLKAVTCCMHVSWLSFLVYALNIHDCADNGQLMKQPNLNQL